MEVKRVYISLRGSQALSKFISKFTPRDLFYLLVYLTYYFNAPIIFPM